MQHGVTLTHHCESRRRQGWRWCAAAMLMGLAGCATERLSSMPPAGVDLSGNWQLNVNLSDDPDRQTPEQKPRRSPIEHSSPGRRAGGVGLPPLGGSNFGAGATPLTAGVASVAGLDGANASAPSATSDATATSDAAAAADLAAMTDARAPTAASRALLLQAPTRLSITQQGSTVQVQTTMADGSTSSERYTAGFRGTVPNGNSTAQRTAGWNGNVFVITTNTSHGSREDDFALDEDGRLIVTLQTRGRDFGKNDLARVYDRLRQ